MEDCNRHPEDQSNDSNELPSTEEQKRGERLIKLQATCNVVLQQINGQRSLKPLDINIPPPNGEGCEVFVGNLPRNVLEDEIYPLFSRIGKIYEIRLMMDFSGSNRGYGFVMYTNPTDAKRAIKVLDKYEIRPDHTIGVVLSINNCRLKISNLPFTLDAKVILKTIFDKAQNVSTATVYKELKRQYRFAIITFKTHRDAAMARKQLVLQRSMLFDNYKKVSNVDWMDPTFEPYNVYVMKKNHVNK